MELEFAIDDCRAQIELERAAQLQPPVHFRLEESMCPASVGLGQVKRHIRVAQELIGFFAVGGRHCDADTGSDDQLMALHLERFDQFGNDLAGKLARALRSCMSLHDREFVTA